MMENIFPIATYNLENIHFNLLSIIYSYILSTKILIFVSQTISMVWIQHLFTFSLELTKLGNISSCRGETTCFGVYLPLH